MWDEADAASPWSEVARWTTGLLEKSEWQAEWITNPDILVPPETEAESIRGVNSGYRSAIVRSPETQKWVAIDLGEEAPVDGVRLYPASPFDWQDNSSAIYFPLRYRIEVANQPDFSDAKVVLDRSDKDQPQPEVGNAAEGLFPSVKARYVRLVVRRLRAENELFANFALSEMEVLSGGRNIARGKSVLALDSIEVPGWSKAFLVDGVLEPIRRKPIQQPVTWMRKSFRLDEGVRRATVFITARGIYELHVNGERIGDHILAPEWTSYHKRSQYQGYDITGKLKRGENAIGVVVAHGWYSGRVGLMPIRRIYGKTPELLIHLHVEYENGTQVRVVSDGSWRRTKEGPIVSSDVYDGESHDARRELRGWDAPGFDDRTWQTAVVVGGIREEALSWQRNEPIRILHELPAVAVTEPRPGVYIFDLGQNMVGRVRLKAQGPAGTEIRVRHGEVLNDAGGLYTDNLRDGWQIDHYILGGTGEEVLEPRFTYHGFRYVEVTGLSRRPEKSAVTGLVFHSAAPQTGEFSTSSSMLNQLYSNIVWTQRGNMMGIPTDCPQRPERLGWTGDIQVFAQSAIFNMDMAAFLSKYLQDMRDDQDPNGSFPDVAPNPVNAAPDAMPVFRENRLHGSPGWGDAGVTLPWDLWVNYADKKALADGYEAAKAWVEHIRRDNPNLLWLRNRGLDPGDWLNGDTLIWPGWPRRGAAMPLPVHATAFFAHSTDLVSRMAAVLGREEEARKYRDLFEQIRVAFQKAYVQPDGRIEGDTQGGYALALNFNLLSNSQRAEALDHMQGAFDKYQGHLSTGFQSTHRLLLELNRAGKTENAYRLVNQRGFPSWSLMIENGATTLWERWDGYVKGRGFQDPGMNSFNHYAFGAVAEWMWRTVIGIHPDEQQPGYKHFFIHPVPGGELTWAKGSYDSIRGRIQSAWKIEGQRFILNISIPANTTATVYLPAADEKQIREGGRPVRQSPHVKWLGNQAGEATILVGSGEYEFTVEKPAKPHSDSRSK